MPSGQTQRARLVDSDGKRLDVQRPLCRRGRQSLEAFPRRGGQGKGPAPRLLLVHRAMHGITRDAQWMEMYENAVEERGTKPSATAPPKSGFEICAKGMGFHGKYRQSWTGSSGVVCLRALWEIESNPAYL